MRGRYDLHPDVVAQWAKNLRVHRMGQYDRQRDFADALGIGQATVNRWENGQSIPSDADKVRIAELLSVRLEDLFPLSRATGVVEVA